MEGEINEREAWRIMNNPVLIVDTWESGGEIDENILLANNIAGMIVRLNDIGKWYNRTNVCGGNALTFRHMTQALGGARMENIVTEKKCSRCGEVKPISEFYKRKDRLSGYLSICKPCRLPLAKKWHLLNKEKTTEAFRKYRAEHIDKRHEQSKAWNRTHSKSHSESNAKYSASHPEVARQITQNRRAREMAAVGVIKKEEWIALLEKYDGKCLCCGSKNKIAMDHIVPLIAGGSHTIGNVQPLCRSCNSRKGVKTIDYRKEEKND